MISSKIKEEILKDFQPMKEALLNRWESEDFKDEIDPGDDIEYLLMNVCDEYGVDYEQVVSGICRTVVVLNDFDYVIKVPIEPDCIKFNKREVEIYKIIPDDIKRFFAECELLDEETGAILMARADNDVEWMESYNSSSHWGSDCTEDFFIDEPYSVVLKIQSFCDSEEINDIHAANVGFSIVDHSPMIIDYAGY